MPESTSLPSALTPPDPIDSYPNSDQLDPGVGLCMSGGGYRAMLFHLGSLWRLNELGYLPKLKRISSVSGGSITSAVLGMNWSNLDFDSDGVARDFINQVVSPIKRLADNTIDVPAGLTGLFWFGTISEEIEQACDEHLYAGATLQDLPDSPRFVINATNVQSGALWRFSKPYMWDYKVGKVSTPTVSLAKAVTASSAFPPVLSPTRLKLDTNDFEPNTGDGLQRPPFTENVVLTDGGVYDNLGLETVAKNYETVLVSDAGGKLEPESNPKDDWARHSYRVLELIDNQVRSLRKRALIDAYKNESRQGAFWGIRTDILDYELNTALPCPLEQTMELAKTPTRLERLDGDRQKQLINWGYAVCDAAIRKYVSPSSSQPDNFPYPSKGVG